MAIENIQLSKSGKYKIDPTGKVIESATGRHIQQAEFQSLGLNAALLPKTTTTKVSPFSVEAIGKNVAPTKVNPFSIEAIKQTAEKAVSQPLVGSENVTGASRTAQSSFGGPGSPTGFSAPTAELSGLPKSVTQPKGFTLTPSEEENKAALAPVARRSSDPFVQAGVPLSTDQATIDQFIAMGGGLPQTPAAAPSVGGGTPSTSGLPVSLEQVPPVETTEEIDSGLEETKVEKDLQKIYDSIGASSKERKALLDARNSAVLNEAETEVKSQLLELEQDLRRQMYKFATDPDFTKGLAQRRIDALNNFGNPDTLIKLELTEQLQLIQDTRKNLIETINTQLEENKFDYQKTLDIIKLSTDWKINDVTREDGSVERVMYNPFTNSTQHITLVGPDPNYKQQPTKSDFIKDDAGNIWYAAVYPGETKPRKELVVRSTESRTGMPQLNTIQTQQLLNGQPAVMEREQVQRLINSKIDTATERKEATSDLQIIIDANELLALVNDSDLQQYLGPKAGNRIFGLGIPDITVFGSKIPTSLLGKVTAVQTYKQVGDEETDRKLRRLTEVINRFNFSNVTSYAASTFTDNVQDALSRVSPRSRVEQNRQAIDILKEAAITRLQTKLNLGGNLDVSHIK